MSTSSNNRLSISFGKGVHFAGIEHKDPAKTKSAGLKHNSKNIKSNNVSETADPLKNGLVRNKSASVDISNEGRELAKKLRDSKAEEIKEKAAQTQSSLERVDALNAKLQSGEELSDEDRDFINEELKKLSAQNYADKRFHVLTREDYEQAMGSLQENMIQRLRLYSDMQQELEAQEYSDEAIKDSQMLAEAQEDQNQKKKIIEILRESIKTDEDDEEDEDVELEDVDILAEDGEEESGVLEFEDEDGKVTEKTPEDKMKFKAMDVISDNKEQLDSMFGQSASESKDVRDANALMDEDLIRTYDILTNDEISEEEKLSAFNESQVNMNELFRNKVVGTVMSKLDFDSWLIGKIEFNAHNNVKEVLKDDSVINSMGGIDMVKDFLTNANAY